MMSSVTLIIAASAMMSSAKRAAFSPGVVPHAGRMMQPQLPFAAVPQPVVSGLAGVGRASVPHRSAVSTQMVDGGHVYDGRDALVEPGTANSNPAWWEAPGMRHRQQRGLVGSTGARRNIDDSPILIQGGSLRTWSYKSSSIERVQVVLSTEGRPLDADIELWAGPDNTPTKMRVYVENGQMRPYSAVIETPRHPNTLAIRNIGQVEFPIAANVFVDDVDQPSAECLSSSVTIQGGALRTYPFDSSVDSVQVLLGTDGRPLNARIELLQGPNNNKQVIELYTEDGMDRPYFMVLETPGTGNVVRVVNTGPIEFPMTASIVPNSISNGNDRSPVIGGDTARNMGPVIGGDTAR